MKRLWGPLLFGLVIGVLVGNLVSSFGFQLIAQKDERMERVSHEPESSRRSDIQIATETASSPRDVLVATAPPEEEYRDALHAIPPHLEIPTFFGPDIEDPELRQLREQAALDFIESLETAGLSETELAAMKEAVAELVDLQLTDVAPDDGSTAVVDQMEDADHVASGGDAVPPRPQP